MTFESNLENFLATARWTGADDAIVAAAAVCQQPRLVVSGRLASGKDTVAELAMESYGCQSAVRVSFATALRREVDDILDLVRRDGLERANDIVATYAGLTTERAQIAANLVCEALSDDPTVHSRMRTREIRLLLQEWGTGIRRASDPDYWVKRSMREVVELLAADRPVYVTDARFINEVEPARRLGFLAVRLEVELAVRAARLRARDGLGIDPAAENHPSEMELEKYRGFDLWVDNSGTLDASTGDVVRAMRDRFPQHV